MSKPKIYAFCPAGCKWETIHKDDFDALTSSANVEPDSNDNWLLTELNCEYTLYKTLSTNNLWNMVLNLRYSVSGLTETININPDSSHSVTDLDNKTYTIPVIPVDGEYIKYMITKVDAYTTSDTTNTVYFRVYLKIKTANTEWQEYSIVSAVGSGISYDYINYLDLKVQGGEGTSKVVADGIINTIENEIDFLKDSVDSLENSVDSLDSSVDSLENSVNAINTKLQYARTNGTINGDSGLSLELSFNKTYVFIVNYASGGKTNSYGTFILSLPPTPTNGSVTSIEAYSADHNGIYLQYTKQVSNTGSVLKLWHSNTTVTENVGIAYFELG